MALTTYGGLTTALAGFSTYTDLTATNYADFVSWAQQEIGRRLRSSVNLKSSTATISSETIAVPTDFGSIRRFYLNTTPARTLLETVSPEVALGITSQLSTQTAPSAVTIEGSSFRFAPLFSGSFTGTLLYYATPGALSASTDTNAVLTKYPYLYLFGAMEALHMYKEDDDQADRFGQRFGSLIEDINSRDAKDSYSGPLQVVPKVGTVV